MEWVRLETYHGPWDEDDPDANFKAEVEAYGRADPLTTLRAMSDATGIPTGALARHALVKWAAEGSETLLAIGPRTTERMWRTCQDAEAAGTDAAKLEAFGTLTEMLGWLRVPLGSGPEGSARTGRRDR